MKYANYNINCRAESNKRYNGKTKKRDKKITYETYLKINGFKNTKAIKAKYIKRYGGRL